MVTKVKLDYINRLIDDCLSEDHESLELKGKFIGDEGLEALTQCDRLESVEDLVDKLKNEAKVIS